MPEEDDVEKRVLHENMIPCVVVKDIIAFAKFVQEKRNIRNPEITIGADGGQVRFGELVNGLCNFLTFLSNSPTDVF